MSSTQVDQVTTESLTQALEDCQGSLDIGPDETTGRGVRFRYTEDTGRWALYRDDHNLGLTWAHPGPGQTDYLILKAVAWLEGTFKKPECAPPVKGGPGMCHCLPAPPRRLQAGVNRSGSSQDHSEGTVPAACPYAGT